MTKFGKMNIIITVVLGSLGIGESGYFMNDYATIREIAEKWELTTRRVQKMCSDGKIPGASKFGRDWAIPRDAEKPVDGRVTTGEYKNWRKQKVTQ